MNKYIVIIAVVLGSFLLGYGILSADEIGVSGEMSSAIKPITTEEEVEIGREVAANVIAQFGIVSDNSLTEYVNLVGLTVAESSPRKDLVWHFAVLDSEILNAFSAPGGYVFVSKGLLDILQNESQLASVLGHEIAHVTQKQVIKEIQKSRIAQAMIPGYVKSAAKNATWMSQVTDVAIQIAWKGLSRNDEFEADRLGMQYAREAGYDAKSFSEVLEMLKAREHDTVKSKQLKFLLSTHPKPEDRILQAQEILQNLPTGGEKLEDRFKQVASAGK